MRDRIISGLQAFLKRHPIVDLGQENPGAMSRRISLSMVPLTDGGVALDAGCREGLQTRRLEQKGYRVIPVDINRLFPQAHVVDLNCPLPFEDSTFHLIYCSEVIEHLKDPGFTVNEFFRVLKVSGIMIVTTPNSYCLIFRILSALGFPPGAIQKKDHIQFFSIEDMMRIFPGSTEVCGYFPFMPRFRIDRWVNLLSPGFIIRARKEDQVDK